MRFIFLLIMHCIMINIFYCSNIFADKFNANFTAVLENAYHSSVVCNTLAPKHLLKEAPSNVLNVCEKYNLFRDDIEKLKEQENKKKYSDEMNVDSDIGNTNQSSKISKDLQKYFIILVILFFIASFFTIMLWLTPLRAWSLLVCGVVFVLLVIGSGGFVGVRSYVYREINVAFPDVDEIDKMEERIDLIEKSYKRTPDIIKELYFYYFKNRDGEIKVFNRGEWHFIKNKKRGWAAFKFDLKKGIPVKFYKNKYFYEEEILKKNAMKKIRIVEDFDCITTLTTEDYNDDIELIEESALGNIKRVKELLAKGTSVNAKAFDGRTALYEACKNNQIEIVKILLNANAKLNSRFVNEALSGGISGIIAYKPLPLKEAVKNEDIEIVKILLNNGAGFCIDKYKDKEVIFKDHEKNKEIIEFFTAKNKREKEINKKYWEICSQDNKDIEISKQYLENIEAILDNIKEKDDDKEKNINDVLTYIVKKDKFPCYYYIKNTMFLKRYLLELIAELKKQADLKNFSKIEFKHNRVDEVNKWTKEDLVKLFRFIEEAA